MGECEVDKTRLLCKEVKTSFKLCLNFKPIGSAFSSHLLIGLQGIL